MVGQSSSKLAAKRRAPAQARARKTREMILEAAIQLLQKRGLRAFSTNRLAEAAGFSVGTIYQYFENKQEILDALARHERDRRLARMTEVLTSRAHEAGAKKLTLRDRIRIAVRTELHAFDGRQRARKILFDLAWRSDTHRDMDRPVTTLAAMLEAGDVADSDEGAVQLSPIDAFILTQAVAGIIRAGLERDEHMLITREFEDTMVELIYGFVDSRRKRKR
jgi:AcrR family transcriptional regulator